MGVKMMTVDLSLVFLPLLLHQDLDGLTAGGLTTTRVAPQVIKVARLLSSRWGGPERDQQSVPE